MSQIQTIESLQNHFLIAMPVLSDAYFSRSVALIVEHTQDGAMGIVINQPSTMTFKQIINSADQTVSVADDLNNKIVVCGGPVYPDRGFVLHSSKPGYVSSIEVTSNIMVTTSKDILVELCNSTGPDKSVVALGYAGWDSGQLEQEIQENVWLTVEADDKILFDTPIHQIWQAAVNKLGIDVWQLSQHAGSA